MALYAYKCVNKECKKHEEEVSVQKPMMESSREEFCEECGEKIDRVFTSYAMKPAGDKPKY